MSIQNKINIAVIGATGYTGLDLIFLLSKHPRVRIQNLCATKSIGKSINFFDKRIKKKYLFWKYEKKHLGRCQSMGKIL